MPSCLLRVWAAFAGLTSKPHYQTRLGAKPFTSWLCFHSDSPFSTSIVSDSLHTFPWEGAQSEAGGTLVSGFSPRWAEVFSGRRVCSWGRLTELVFPLQNLLSGSALHGGKRWALKFGWFHPVFHKDKIMKGCL